MKLEQVGMLVATYWLTRCIQKLSDCFTFLLPCQNIFTFKINWAAHQTILGFTNKYHNSNFGDFLIVFFLSVVIVFTKNKVWYLFCLGQTLIKEIQIKLRLFLFLVIAMYCQASSINHSTSHVASWLERQPRYMQQVAIH